jgi:hypothetical protein
MTENDVSPACVSDFVAGKTVDRLVYDESDAADQARLYFTDGSWLILQSWDYEGYRSGICFHLRENV